MIPKVIHYIWLGGNPLPEMVLKCMESWKKICPDYEIKRWDESNLDIDCCTYCRDAYDVKKYAFASDVLRFYVLKNEGGIYLDVDVELVKSLDCFLEHRCFMGIECCGENLAIAPGLILGSEKEGKIVSDMYEFYKSENFYYSNGEINYDTICNKTTKYISKKYGVLIDGTTLHFDDVSIYSPEYFCPINGVTKEPEFYTENTYSKHLYLASWVPKQTIFKKIETKFKSLIKLIIGKKNTEKIRQRRKAKREKKVKEEK